MKQEVVDKRNELIRIAKEYILQELFKSKMSIFPRVSFKSTIEKFKETKRKSKG